MIIYSIDEIIELELGERKSSFLGKVVLEWSKEVKYK
jgi:hypothetical protein